MLISTFVFLFFLFLTFALYLFASRKSDARQVRLQQRVAQALDESRSEEVVVHLAREDSIGGNPTINRLLSSLDVVKRIDRMIQQADASITVSRLLAFSLVAGVLAGLAASTILGFYAAIVFAVLAAAAPLLHISKKRSKRLVKFNAQLPDTLDLLSRSLAVGHAFSES